MLNFVLPGEGSEFLLLLLTLLLGHQNLSEPAFKLSEPVRTSTKELRMAERKTLLGKSQAEPDFLHFNDLACEAVGGKVIFATDEWFAPAKNLLKKEPPQFKASAFTDFGKWMDGWETRRKRIPGHDWCIIQLGVPGSIYGFDVDTSFFTGNHSPHISIQGGCLDQMPAFTLDGDRTGMAASSSEMAAAAKLGSEAWPELVGVSPLQPGYSDCCHNYFRTDFRGRVTHLRLNMLPDGGIARLRVYGVGLRDWSTVSTNQKVDLVALTNGGMCLGYSNAHFGHPRNMIGLGQAANMADGWETARRLDRPKELKVNECGILQVPGYEWAVFRLGHPGVISSIEVDTTHFKGNFPDSCRLEACLLTQEEERHLIKTSWNSVKWEELLPPQKLHPHCRHQYSAADLIQSRPFTHIRLVIRPDGGVSRLRLWGRPTQLTVAPSNLKRQTSKL
ncbi:probable allantoicase isoform X2 [Oryzias latipes]|uniref:Allantoate amidinohydrolase n=1 Tax=Oryzias latipes TaxID=8090 RepID=H2MV89_ORYLA|nr:probable allantoicase isoform X2 [Oryzias latipes]